MATLSHLGQWDKYTKMLIIDYRFALKTILPDVLADKSLHVDLPSCISRGYQSNSRGKVRVVQYKQPGHKHQQNKEILDPRKRRFKADSLQSITTILSALFQTLLEFLFFRQVRYT